MCVSINAQTQRRVTPVEKPTNTTLPGSYNYGDKLPKAKWTGPKIDKDTIINDTLYIAPSPLNVKMEYPLLNSVILGVNLWDPLMMAFGQSYGGIDFSAELSLWNRIIPAIELGMGRASSTPEDMNFTYKGKLAPYFKFGANYNFLFNKTPDYQAMIGFRMGYSSFKYDITDITIESPYWKESQKTSILDQKSHALWGEVMFAIRVKIIKNVSMGWAFKYHFLGKYKKNENSDPWYIPGFGVKGRSIAGAVSVFYTLPLAKEKKAADKDAYTGEPLKTPTKGNAPTNGTAPIEPPSVIQPK